MALGFFSQIPGICEPGVGFSIAVSSDDDGGGGGGSCIAYESRIEVRIATDDFFFDQLCNVEVCDDSQVDSYPC